MSCRPFHGLKRIFLSILGLMPQALCLPASQADCAGAPVTVRLSRALPTLSKTSTICNAVSRRPPDDARIMMRWWWFGPAVTKPQLEREMRLMKEGGIGGFEVQPVYPVALDDETAGIKTFPFLSDEFIDALRFTSEKARELGLRFDLTLGSGWPFGGPFVPLSDAAGKLRYENVKVSANSRRVKVPDIGIGEKLLAVFVAQHSKQLYPHAKPARDH